MDESHALNRRQVLRLIGGATLAAVPAIGLAGHAGAARSWCRLDPTFQVDDLIGNVYVSGEIDRSYDVTGPIKLRFSVPVGSEVTLLSSDEGFGHGYDVSYVYDRRLKRKKKGIEIRVAAYVPAVSDKLPILLEFVPDETIKFASKQSGTTNQWLKVNTFLRR
jgi:hypothetical protein